MSMGFNMCGSVYYMIVLVLATKYINTCGDLYVSALLSIPMPYAYTPTVYIEIYF